MFSAGTRVSVHSSNISGKKLGPKCHSLGYTSVTNQCYFVPHIEGFPIKEQAFLICPLRVQFTRYGREQRSRSELRSFLNIMPVFMNAKGIIISQRVEEVLEQLNNEMLSSTWFTNLLNNYGSDSLGVLLPLRSYRAEKMSYDECTSWAMSIIRNSEYAHILATNKNLPTLKALHTQESKLWSWANKASGSSDARRGLLQWAEQSPEKLQRFVHFVRITSTAFNKGLAENGINGVKNLFEQGGEMNANAFMTWYTLNMFDGHNIMERKFKITRSPAVSKDFKEFADCMRLVRSTYLNLKPKYV
jgi:hypothetical protein